MLRLLLIILLAGGLGAPGTDQAASQSGNIPAWQSRLGYERVNAGMIRDLNTGQKLTAQQLADRLAQAPRVLVGEQHDNPDHHALELWVLQVLADRRSQGSLLLEMLDPNQQSRVDEAKAAYKSVVPADLPTELAWQEGWDWALYGPIVRYALGQSYPLLSANLDPDEITAIYTQQPLLTGVHSTALVVREQLLAQIRDSHCGQLPEEHMPAMLAVQQQRDRRMAQRLLAAPVPALLFAGAYHVRKDVGVPIHLLDLGAADGTVVLLLAEVGAYVTSASADYVWYTAASSRKDYCAQWRNQSK
ncbi:MULTISPECIES: ChaN family lipoprotein [unclassified Pseudomonas]|uniref:ChaN family lipoprotein n=1 Tax=unclassified Pseudomonas TaxID=196821 RepID=UPI002AC9DF2E|nr:MULTISPECIES: ChaN family lipoprotein [unclassified Pseudomonas]MEB0040733.1 ChaN family lipoprotein [Pseudomonas sp. MH10]MEB0078631.1 ChaN family lipoprotein [Pseudomonas sp. MH10out]MEB0091674.1 ChaN family lipoprotein [Pseudomonas sp. CCI4.2]MEB0099924.1 ChaN family lipoprotein [Pseudomonas sp. CCI3.2]MEB0123589.1 ChaN family lipoprotein [Pseudomonas sp. CCI1.2]